MQESKIFRRQNLTEKVNYVYRVTIDGKYYIGKRTGCLNDLHTGRYKTSSNIIKEKLQNGLHFSKIKILQVFPTAKDALEFEERILTRVDAKANLKFLNQSNGNKDFCFKQHTEKSKKKLSKAKKAQFDENTEYGRKQRENKSQSAKSQFDINTEEGRKNRENMSKNKREYFNPNTEEGRLHLEENRRRKKEYFNPNTEKGRKNLENNSENLKIARQKRDEILIQNRQNNSILGELMFDENFIRQNLLIVDDKNNLRFLWLVYSKLTGYSSSHIRREKRKGKLSFLSGIKAIKLSEEQENAKIQEIEAIIKSLNNEKE